jgi:hypothetical protein
MVIRKTVKKGWVNYHLKYKCPKCSASKKKKRDILGCGECFWYQNWTNGNHDIPMWMGIINMIKCYFNKPIKVRLGPLTLRQKLLKYSLIISFVFVIVLFYRK